MLSALWWKPATHVLLGSEPAAARALEPSLRSERSGREEGRSVALAKIMASSTWFHRASWGGGGQETLIAYEPLVVSLF